MPELVEIRGEVFIRVEDFAKMNAQRQAEGLKMFANPRNAAAGAMRQKDPAETARRPLRLICHGIGAREGFTPASQHAAYEALAAWGLPVSPYTKQVHSAKEVLEQVAYWADHRHDATTRWMASSSRWTIRSPSSGSVRPAAPRAGRSPISTPEEARTRLHDIRLGSGALAGRPRMR